MTDHKNYKYHYKDWPKQCDPEDFWGQVKRTVNGKAVSQDQIDLIVDAVTGGLELNSNDVFLDLCCGNGALTTYFFSTCRGGTGVDLSDFLIDVAMKHFHKKDNDNFIVEDVVQFANTNNNELQYSKGLCYGSFQYLPKESAAELIKALFQRFPTLSRFYIGNIPNREMIREFYRENYEDGIETRDDSPIGIWYTKEEITSIATAAGWHIEISQMPKEYYGSLYRFDAVLSRDPQ